MNLNGTLKIFKELGRPEQAQQLLDFYMANRHEKAAFFDLNAHPFGSDITEPELRAAFAGRRASAPKNQDLAQALSRIGKNQGRDEEDLEFLASASVSDNVELFKRLRGSELKSAIYTALQFGKFSNSSEPMKRIVATASEALRRIARKSTINARRVRMYGVTVGKNHLTCVATSPFRGLISRMITSFAIADMASAPGDQRSEHIAAFAVTRPVVAFGAPRPFEPQASRQDLVVDETDRIARGGA